MSLKVFHLIFIVVSVALAVFCAIWSFSNQTAQLFGYASIAAALGLVIYGAWFLKKSKKIIT